MGKQAFYLTALLLVLMITGAKAQRPNYTLIQLGGMAGVYTTSEFSPIYGYSFHFIFGRNFDDRFQVGLGIGNDAYRGRTTVTEGRESVIRVNTLPIFLDARAPFADAPRVGKFGVMANVGYAPGLGADYQRGFMGKVGLTYGYYLNEGSELLFSAGYGFQEFNSRFLVNAYQQHNIFLSVGFFIH